MLDKILRFGLPSLAWLACATESPRIPRADASSAPTAQALSSTPTPTVAAPETPALSTAEASAPPPAPSLAIDWRGQRRNTTRPRVIAFDPEALLIDADGGALVIET